MNNIMLAIVVGLLLAIGTYQWKDCLAENSLLTCARMLNK
jgi:hypothetical protein